MIQLCTFCEKVSYIHFLPEFTTYSAANMKIFKQLVKGVDFIHSNGLIHRDLKVCKVDFVLVISLFAVVIRSYCHGLLCYS